MSDGAVHNLLSNPPHLDTARIELLPHQRIKLSGAIRDREAVTLLGSYFQAVHAQALRQRLAQVSLDVSELTFVSAAVLRLFVEWAAVLLEQGKPYRLRLFTSRLVAWQKSSLPSLAALAPLAVDVERVD